MRRLLPIVFVGWPILFLTAARAHYVPNATQLDFVAARAPFGTDNDQRYTDVWGQGGYAYLGSVDSGVAVIELEAETRLVGTYAPAGHADFQDVKVVGDIGYFSGGLGTDVVDLSNPAAPTMLSRIDASNGGHAAAQNVAVSGNLLFQVADDSSQISVFNTTNPAAPSFLRTIDTHDSVGLSDVTLIDNRLYAAGLGGETYLYDVANVATQQPQLTAAIPTGPNTSSVWPTPDGDTFIATHRELGGKLAAWDISSPATSSLIQSADPSDFEFNSYSTSEVVVVDSYAYVAWYQAGLEVIDLDRLETTGMQRLGFYIPAPSSLPNTGFTRVRSVYPLLGKDRILISDTRSGLYVLDATVLPQVGDYNSDGEITVNDYTYWRDVFRLGLNNPKADGNGDGTVDAADYIVWRVAIANAGGGTSSQFVPEPKISAMLLPIIVAAVRRPSASGTVVLWRSTS
jgi:hypothetical protein